MVTYEPNHPLRRRERHGAPAVGQPDRPDGVHAARPARLPGQRALVRERQRGLPDRSCRSGSDDHGPASPSCPSPPVAVPGGQSSPATAPPPIRRLRVPTSFGNVLTQQLDKLNTAHAKADDLALQAATGDLQVDPGLHDRVHRGAAADPTHRRRAQQGGRGVQRHHAHADLNGRRQRPAATRTARMVGRAKDIANRLTPLQKVALGAVVLTVVAGAMVVSKTEPADVDVARCTPTSARPTPSSVVDSLSARGVEYDLTDAGKTVLVPKDDVYDLRVATGRRGPAVVERGLCAARQPGHHDVGVPSAHRLPACARGRAGQDADRDRRRAVGRRCTWRCPTNRCSSTSPATPTASVLVAGKGDRRHHRRRGRGDRAPRRVVGEGHEAGRRHRHRCQRHGAVVAAVEGVTGGARHARSAEGRSTSTSSACRRRSMALLTRMTGPNKVAVTVNAELDLDESQSTSENFEPIGENPRHGQVLTEKTSTEEYRRRGRQRRHRRAGPRRCGHHRRVRHDRPVRTPTT